MKRTIRHSVIILVLIATGFSVGAQDRVQLPDMGGSAGRVFAPGEERQYASEIERYLRAHNLLVEDPLITDFFADMGYLLASRGDQPERDYRFLVIRSPDINAFAAPGGVVALNAGLILAADSESMVAGVMAHEIAHVTQNHIARGLEDIQQTSMPIMLATLGLALAAGLAGAGGDAIPGLLMTGQGLAVQRQINYTRQMEYEADRVGIGLLSRAGYDPAGMAEFFTRLGVISRAYGEGPAEYLRTHPLSTTRTAEAKSRAERMPPARREESLKFHQVQARLRVLMTPRPLETETYFTSRLERGTGPYPEAHSYGLALANLRAGKLDTARAYLDPLLEEKPDSVIYRLLLAEWYIAANEVAQAVQELATLHHTYGGNRVVALKYSEALLFENDRERARVAADILRRELRLDSRNVQLHDMMARAADRAGEPVRAGEAVAESYYLRGGLMPAIEQLERLSRRDDLDYYQRARISARLSEMRAEHASLGPRRRG